VKTGSPGAGGGGVSSLWSRPSWQNAPGIAASATMRLVPDCRPTPIPTPVSFSTSPDRARGRARRTASPVGTPWRNVDRFTDGEFPGRRRGPGLRYRSTGVHQPLLYDMASTGFVDVTTGSNDLYSVGEYSAGVGYDEASGLGSPNGAGFFAGLCRRRSTPRRAPSSSRSRAPRSTYPSTSRPRCTTPTTIRSRTPSSTSRPPT